MLKPALLYADVITRKFAELLYTKDYFIIVVIGAEQVYRA